MAQALEAERVGWASCTPTPALLPGTTCSDGPLSKWLYDIIDYGDPDLLRDLPVLGSVPPSGVSCVNSSPEGASTTEEELRANRGSCNEAVPSALRANE